MYEIKEINNYIFFYCKDRVTGEVIDAMVISTELFEALAKQRGFVKIDDGVENVKEKFNFVQADALRYEVRHSGKLIGVVKKFDLEKADKSGRYKWTAAGFGAVFDTRYEAAAYLYSMHVAAGEDLKKV